MTKFYKCEVFEYIDIIEVDAGQTRHVHNETGNWHDGLNFVFFDNRYVLVSSDYRKVTLISQEEAYELSEERAVFMDEEWLHSKPRKNQLEFNYKKREL